MQFKVTGKYRPDIDGLRAIAVGAVVGFHAFPNYFKGGYVGVDVFFVISGFLISGIIFEAIEAGTFSYLQFYARRIKRILPALIVVCGTVFLAGWYVLLPDEFRRLGKHLSAGAGFVSNLALWNEAGYFDPTADTKPLLHLWSLGIEEQFYIVWPLALGLVWKRTRGFVIVTLIVAAISFAVNLATVYHDPVAAFYSPLARFWEMMIGGMLAYLMMHSGEWFSHFSTQRSIAGLLLIATGIFMLNKETAFPGYWALLPTIGTFLVISAPPHGFINKYVLSNSLMVGVGLISYSLYLWHWPILVFFKIVKGSLLTPTERATAVALSFALAVLTYRFVERPFRRASIPAVPLGLAGSAAVVAAIGMIMFAGTLSPRLNGDNLDRILAASTDWEYPPAVAQNHNLGPLRYFQQSSSLETYTLFFGDSNMEQYAPRIDRAIRDHLSSYRGAILVGNQNGCLLLKEIMTDGSRCPDAVAQLRNLIARDSTHSVVIAVSWMIYEDALVDTDKQLRLARFLRSISQTKRVYLILNIPEGEELSPRNMFEGSRLATITAKPISNVAFDLNRFEDRYRDINRIISAIAKESGATVIDPVAYLCPQRRCPIFDDTGKPLYLDSLHITRSYALRAATYIDATLK